MGGQRLGQSYNGLVRLIRPLNLHPGVEARLGGFAGLAGDVGTNIFEARLFLLLLETLGNRLPDRLGTLETEVLEVVVSVLLLAVGLQGFPGHLSPGTLVQARLISHGHTEAQALANMLTRSGR